MSMQLFEDVSLKDHSTMRLGGDARYLTTVNSQDELAEAVKWAQENQQPILAIGDGSNLIFRDSGWEGLVIVMKIPGYEVIKDDEHISVIRIGGGENWDETVRRTVDSGLSGIEALSLIPGTAGAAPVQNIGAYGQEVAQTLEQVELYDPALNELKTLTNKECIFKYRDSIFKHEAGERYIITAITLRLSKSQMQPPFYDSLQRRLDENGVQEFTPAAIREAVIAIRSQKLPDPRQVANTGSFFKNPHIKKQQYETLKKTYPDMPGHESSDGLIKVPAGWLMEQAGFRDFRHDNGMGTYEKHALVFVNYSAHSYRDLALFKKEVIDKVRQLFGIELIQEPETV